MAVALTAMDDDCVSRMISFGYAYAVLSIRRQNGTLVDGRPVA